MQHIHLINDRTEHIERRQGDHTGQDGIHSQRRVGDIGDVGAEDDEGRMGDIDDVEHAERDRYADGDRGVKAAKQQPGHQGVAEEIEGHFHYVGQSGEGAESLASPLPMKPRAALTRLLANRSD